MEVSEDLILALRGKWCSLSEVVKEAKQGFVRFYRRRHHRKGIFRSERFKAAMADNGETLKAALSIRGNWSMNSGFDSLKGDQANNAFWGEHVVIRKGIHL